MWLPITAAAAVITSVLWYVRDPTGKYKLPYLSLIYWGATLMWLVDGIIAHYGSGRPFLEISVSGTALGLSVLALGLVVWLIRLFLGVRGMSNTEH